MNLDFFVNEFRKSRQKDSMVWRDRTYSYAWLLERYQEWNDYLITRSLPKGKVAFIESGFSPNSIALLLALIKNDYIVVPLTDTVQEKREKFVEIAEGELTFRVDDNDSVEVSELPHTSSHQHYQELKARGNPGLVLFSSGSTGKSKASVHDLKPFMDKFKANKRTFRTLTFLLYDHIGGLNTLLYTLSNGGCLVTVEDRDPDSVLHVIEKYQVELLPTSPTFINLILISEAYERHDLSSLELVTYGTEPMPESTLNRFHELFPDIRLKQTYGLSEVGILRTESKDSDSLWMKLGGEGFDTRVEDGILQIKAKSAMLGYLNAPDPFTDDGWFITGDAVEVEGDYFKILGRDSEIINVGGQKVYPAEVEGILEEMDQVKEAVVYGENNPITGEIVCAEINLVSDRVLNHEENIKEKIKKHCAKKIDRYKIPAKIEITETENHTARFKKKRPN